MKVFFKHLLRDVLRFPYQTLLIILTLSISVSIGISTFKTQRMFYERALWLEKTSSSLGDVTVSVGASDIRMIFDSDIKKMLTEHDRMLGEFKMSAFAIVSENEKQIVNLCATDLESADGYFEFQYVEYGRFTTQNQNESVIISKSCADALEKRVGDSITLSLLGKELNFTVQAIAENSSFLEERDILVPISKLQSFLSDYLPTLAVLGNSFMPYTQIMIRLADKDSIPSLVDKIHANVNLKHCNVEITSSKLITDTRILAQTGAIFLISSVVIILCAILSLSCMRLLEEKRRQDYALFSCIGASQKQIELLRMSESLLYALVSLLIALPISSPTVKYVASLVTREDKEMTLGLDGVLFGIIFAFAFITACTLRHISKTRSSSLKERLEFESVTAKKPLRIEIILIPLLILLFVSACFVSVKLRIALAVAILFTLVTLCAFTVPRIVKTVSKALAELALHKCKRSGKAILHFRAFENNFALRHICMILTVSFTLVACVSLCQNTAKDIMTSFHSSINSKHVIINSTPDLTRHIKGTYDVECIGEMSLFSDAEVQNKYVCFAISLNGDHEKLVDNDILPKALPTGHNVALSRPLAELCKLKSGDTFTLELKGSSHTVTLCEIFEYKTPIAFFDADALGIRRNICMLDLNETQNGEGALDRLREDVELNGSSLETPNALLSRAYQTVLAFISITEGAMYLSVMLTLVACANSVISGYRHRKQEFYILSLSGMSKKAIRIKIFSELVTLVALSIIISLPMIAVSFCVIDLGASSFGISVF